MSTSIPAEHTRVLVPLDLSSDGHDAFEHALKIVLVTRGKMVPLHVHDPDASTSWSALPKVKTLLVRWGVLHEDAGPEQYAELGISVEPHDRAARRPEDAVEIEVTAHHYDLVIMHSAVRQGLDQWLSHSTSLGIARRVPSAALLLSGRVRPLVASDTGVVTLQQVLIPLGDAVEAQVAVDTAVAFAAVLGVERAHGTLLHLGDAPPAVRLPDHWTWDTRHEGSGNIVSRVVELADALNSDLIVMASRGHDSLRDALFGSITERVVPRVLCPVLIAPV